tara:strand:- start:2035 stop:2286 length:252 start_codon:yes stop_codon:yes gene_type:complete
MTIKDVPKDVQLAYGLEDSQDMIIQKCVQLRKDAKESVVELSKWLDLDRRKLHSFEKGKFNIDLAQLVLNWYGYQIKIDYIAI